MSGTAHPGAWRIGAWSADPSDDTLTRGTEVMKIEPRMMRLLLRLAESPGAVLSHEQLLSEVWSGVIVGPASVYQSISQLRKVLGDTGPAPTYIETVARKGYRLIAAVHPPGAQPVAATLSAPQAPTAASRVASVRRHWLGLIAGAAVIVIAVAGALLWPRRTREPSTVASIAVLPLLDTSATKADQPLGDGVSEELTNWLAQIPTLRVVARSSSFAFRDRQSDVRAIGRALGTTHVLEGSLRRSGGALRVIVQLVGTHDGYSVWSGSFDAGTTDVMHVPEEVARAVANNLELRLTDAALGNLDDRRSASVRAYSLYLVARHHQQLRSKQDNERAIELYKEAIAADPGFALAQVGLAYAYLNRRYLNDDPIEAIAREAEPLLASAARKAPRLPDLYVVRGALETELLRSDAALKDLQYAAALNPNSRDAAAEIGYHYLVSGEPRRALEHYSHAADLDPLDYNLQAQRCMALTDLGKFDAAAAACQRARTLDPTAAWAYSASGILEEARGRLGEALKWSAAALEHSPDVEQIYAVRGYCLMSLGLIERARQAYETGVVATGDPGGNSSLVWLDLVTLYAVSGVHRMRERITAAHLDATSDPDSLFALARAELLAGDPRSAQAYVSRALTSPALRAGDLASPWLARTGYSYLLIAAAAEQASGDAAAARARLGELGALLDRLTAAGMRRHGVYELQAQVAALRGDADEAIAALRRAADFGWRDAWLAEHEPYFARLRGRADYRALIEEVRDHNAAESKLLAPALLGTPAPTT